MWSKLATGWQMPEPNSDSRVGRDKAQSLTRLRQGEGVRVRASHKHILMSGKPSQPLPPSLNKGGKHNANGSVPSY